MSPLSAGVCAWLNKAHLDELEALDVCYAVQVLSIKNLIHTTRTASTKDRYRLILSDGIHFVQAVLATQLNDLVALGDIVKYAIVVVDRVTCHYLLDRRLIVILGLHVVSRDEERIGNPIAAPASSTTPANRT